VSRRDDENTGRNSLYKIGTEGTGASSCRNHYLDRQVMIFVPSSQRRAPKALLNSSWLPPATLLDQHNH